MTKQDALRAARALLDGMTGTTFHNLRRLNMKTIARVFALALLLVSGACSSAAPDAGFEAVLIKKPLIMGHGGVDPTPVKTGRTFIALTTDAVYVDMRPHQKSEQVNDMMSADGVPLDFDAKIRLQVTDSVRLVKEFGIDWYRVNVGPVFLRYIRDAVKKRGMNETAITAKAADEIDNEVTDAMKAYLTASSLPIRLVDVTLGKANPPDAIKNQRIETAAQEQRQNTERYRKLAEDQRREAESSRAKADNAYREAMQLTPDQFLQLENIKMLGHVCAGGKCSMVLGAGVMPTMTVGR